MKKLILASVYLFLVSLCTADCIALEFLGTNLVIIMQPVFAYGKPGKGCAHISRNSLIASNFLGPMPVTFAMSSMDLKGP